jgi:hypothetical protein
MQTNSQTCLQPLRDLTRKKLPNRKVSDGKKEHLLHLPFSTPTHDFNNLLDANFKDTVIPRAAASLSMDYQGWCGPGDLLHPARMKQQIPRAAETNPQSS